MFIVYECQCVTTKECFFCPAIESSSLFYIFQFSQKTKTEANVTWYILKEDYTVLFYPMLHASGEITALKLSADMNPSLRIRGH